MYLTVALHIGVFLIPPVGNATLSPDFEPMCTGLNYSRCADGLLKYIVCILHFVNLTKVIDTDDTLRNLRCSNQWTRRDVTTTSVRGKSRRH